MSRLSFDGMAVVLTCDGENVTLVDALDVKNNHSSVRMQAIVKDADGSEQLTYPFAEALMDAWRVMERDEERVILTRVARFLMEKQRNVTALVMGCASDAERLMPLESFVKRFDEDSCIYVDGGDAFCGVLPRDAYDIVISCGGDMDANALTMVKRYGVLFFVLDSIGDIGVVRRMFGDAIVYSLDDDFIVECRMTPQLWQRIYEVTYYGAMDALIRVTGEEIVAIGRELSTATHDDMKPLIQRMQGVESVLVTIFPARASVTIKRTANEAKAMMIDYALGIVEPSVARKAYDDFISDWNRG